MNSALQSVIAFVTKVLNALGQIFGWSIEINAGGIANDMEDAADGASDTAGGLGDAAKNAKKLKNNLLGIDELNIISPDDTSSGGGGGASGGGGLSDDTEDFMSVDTIQKKMESPIKTLTGLGHMLGQSLIDALRDIDWDSVYKAAENFGRGLAEFLNGLISPELFYEVGRTIANCLNTALSFLDGFGTTFDWSNFGKSIASGINGFVENIDWQKAYKVASTYGKGIADSINNFVDQLNAAEIGRSLARVVGVISTFFEDLGTNIKWTEVGKKFADGVNGFIKRINVKQVARTINAWAKGLLDAFISAVKNIKWDELGKKIGEFIAKIDFAGVLKKIGQLIWAAINAAVKTYAGMFSAAPVETAILSLVAVVKLLKTDIVSKFITELGKGKGVLSALGNSVPVLGNAFAAASIGVEEFVTQLKAGNGVIPSIKSGFEAIKTVLTPVEKALIGIGAAVGEFALVSDAVYSLSTGTGDLALNITELATSIGIAGAAFSAVLGFPAGLIATGIVGIAGALSGLNKEFEETTQIENYGGIVSDIMDDLSNSIEDVQSKAENFKNSFELTGTAEETYLTHLSDEYFKLAGQVSLTEEEKEKLKNISAELVGQLPELQNYYNEETGLIATTKDEVAKLIEQKKQEMRIEAAHDMIVQAYKDEAEAVKVAKDAGDELANAYDKLKSKTDAHADALARLEDLRAYDELSQQMAYAENVSDDLIQKFNELGEKIKADNGGRIPTLDELEIAVGSAETAMKNAEGTYSGFQELNRQAVNELAKVRDNIAGLENTMFSSSLGVGKNVADGMSEGIKENAGEVASAGEKIGTDAVEASAKAAEVHSPSRKTQEQGHYIDEGLALGITENTNIPVEAAKNMCTAVMTAITESFSTETLSTLFSADMWTNCFTNMTTAFTAKWTEFTDLFAQTVTEWTSSTVPMYFSQEVWSTASDGMRSGIMTTWTTFTTEFATGVSEWESTATTGMFSAESWTSASDGIRVGIMNTWNAFTAEWSTAIAKWDSEGLKAYFNESKWTGYGDIMRNSLISKWTAFTIDWNNSASTWMNTVSTNFGESRWLGFGTAMFGSLMSKWNEFVASFNTSFESWKLSITTFFSVENWTNLGNGMFTSILTGLTNFINQWNANFDMWWQTKPTVFFGLDMWTGFGKNIQTGLLTKWKEFISLWTTSFTGWWNKYIAVYFGRPKWLELGENIRSSLISKWEQYITDWHSIFDPWWTEEIEVKFSVDTWNEFGENMRTGLYQGFKGIVEQIGGIMNGIIGVFNEGLDRIENAINDMIDDFNDIAEELGVDSLSHVHAETISTVTIPSFATGGYPLPGSYFRAGEAGAEMVGVVGGKTAVASNGEITGIRDAVQSSGDATLSVLNSLLQVANTIADKDVNFTLDERGIVKLVRSTEKKMGYNFT